MTPKASPSTPYLEEKAELEAVLASGIFARAPSLEQFLSYICRKYFEGETGLIKEYNIAVEALGRPPNFDQKSDAIVRVEAHRLRRRLRQYYENEGAGHALELSIPPGSYVPVFRQKLATLPAVRTEVLPAEQALTPEILVPKSKMRWFAAGGLVLLAAGLVASRMVEPVSTRRPGPPPIVPEGAEMRILAGSTQAEYLDRMGRLWAGDRFFSGGKPLANTERAVTRTPDAAIFRNRREGNFQYDIPLKPGGYELRLYFAETVYGAGNPRNGGETSRLFDLFANGKQLLREFDVIADTGGSNVADIKVFKDISPAADGILHLAFRSSKEDAMVNAIEIFPAAAGRIRPIRILAQDVMYVDKQDRVWSSDRFFQGGNTVVRETPVKNAAEPTIYRGERYGNFTYTIPVAPGRYRITFKFAETWFGPRKTGGGGVGSRIFDVYCNGVALLKNFDIFKEAGGSDLALDRSFSALEPNAQDKFVLSFVPVRNYACVNAIEVE